MTVHETTTAKVLVVDDSLTVRKALEDLLVRQPYEVHLAGDGEQALSVLRAETIDVVILDLIMPGKSGEETLHELRAISRTVPIIISSGLILLYMTFFKKSSGVFFAKLVVKFSHIR